MLAFGKHRNAVFAFLNEEKITRKKPFRFPPRFPVCLAFGAQTINPQVQPGRDNKEGSFTVYPKQILVAHVVSED